MFEAYRIGIRVSLINHVSHGMSMIINHMTGGGKAAKALQQELNKIKLLGLGGAVTAGAGFMGLGMIGKTIKPASEYVHQLALMNQAGMKHLEIVKSTQAAWDATKTVPTSSVGENLEAIRDLRMVFGNTEHAIGYMPTLQKIQGILGTVRHGEAAAKSESYELAKALEMKGSVRTSDNKELGHKIYTNSEFSVQADLIAKAIVASGGKVGATDFLSTFKYGRAATAGWSDDFAYKILPTLIQEMKTRGGSSGAAGGPGASLMSMYAAVVGGVVTQRALGEWKRLGLVDSTKEVWTRDGHLKGVKPGGIIGGNLFQSDPYRWVREILMPAMVRSGLTTEPQQKQAIQYLFPNRTAGFIASQFATQSWKFDRDRVLMEQAQGLAGYNTLLKSDPMMAKMALTKQWDSLLAILGYQIMPVYIRGMQMGIDVTRGMANWIQKHSIAAKVLVGGFTLLSLAMAGLGTAAVVYAGIKALGLVLPGLKAAGIGVGGVSMLVKVLTGAGKAGLVGAVAIASYALGKWIAELTGLDKRKIGSALYDRIHPKGSEKQPAGWNAEGKWVGIRRNPTYSGAAKDTTPKYITAITSVPAAPRLTSLSPVKVAPKTTTLSPVKVAPKTTTLSPVKVAPKTTTLSPVKVAPKTTLPTPMQHKTIMVKPVSALTPKAPPVKSGGTKVVVGSGDSAKVQPLRTVRPNPTKQMVQVHTRLNLDGRAVADVVTNHQADAIDGPQFGGGRFDSILTPAALGR